MMESDLSPIGDIMTHRYAWKNNEKRRTLFGRSCRVLYRLALGSVIIEFENGQRECVSRRALRRLAAPGK